MTTEYTVESDVSTDEKLIGRKINCTVKADSVTTRPVAHETKPEDDTFIKALTNEVAESVKKHGVDELGVPANGASVKPVQSKRNSDTEYQIR